MEVNIFSIWMTVVRAVMYVFIWIAYPELAKQGFKEFLKLGWKEFKKKRGKNGNS